MDEEETKETEFLIKLMEEGEIAVEGTERVADVVNFLNMVLEGINEENPEVDLVLDITFDFKQLDKDGELVDPDFSKLLGVNTKKTLLNN